MESRWLSLTVPGLEQTEFLNNPYGLFNPYTMGGLLDENNLDLEPDKLPFWTFFQLTKTSLKA